MKTKEWLKKHWLELWLVYGFSALIPGWLGDTDLMLAMILPFGAVIIVYDIKALKRIIAKEKVRVNEK
jgi:hypothetical protein